MSASGTGLKEILDQAAGALDRALQDRMEGPVTAETGHLVSVGQGIGRLAGLPGLRADELVRFEGGALGLAFNLDPGEVGIVMLDEPKGLEAGAPARRTGRVMDVPVGDAVSGRVLDALGRPLDNGKALTRAERRAVEQPAPEIMDRAPVTRPLQTGLKVVDGLIPIGRGQRELILGDRQTGKTAVALQAIANQKDGDVACVYCAIGKRASEVARVVAGLQEREAMAYTTVVAATGEDQPGLQFLAPYAAVAMGEYFRDAGRDALVVMDDLTRHAWAYREVSLLLRRPPGREAYPGDIFHIHSRLLERSTQLREEEGGGSLTALPIIETEAQNISTYIPTNLISITDGQLYLSPDLFQQGLMPAVDVGKSVSRVGGKAQRQAYREVAGDLKLTYSQFEELESFSRFGGQLDEETQRTLARGRRIREVLKQPEHEGVPVPEQVAVLVAVNQGAFDRVPLARMRKAELAVREGSRDVEGLQEALEEDAALSDDVRDRVAEAARGAVAEMEEDADSEDSGE